MLNPRTGAALNYLRLARSSDPSTSDGVVTSDRTFYDGEVDVAYVHWRTARALLDKGYVDLQDLGDCVEIRLRGNA